MRPAAPAQTLRVPAEFVSIQAAVEAARDGDTILIAPGLYRENIRFQGKTLRLVSEQGYRQTIIDGGGKTVLTIKQAGPATTLTGFTIQNGEDGISTSSKIRVIENRLTGNQDGIDYEGGGGICRGNLFENNRDDGIDLDQDCEVVLEGNVVRNNQDDGIEIRLHPYTGPMLSIVIRENVISANGEDGIQLIGYNVRSHRALRIERNLITDTAMAAVGCMEDANTRENYQAAPLPEAILLIHNTFVGNHYGVTGGHNMLVLNNIFLRTRQVALKRVGGDSIAAHNLFWGNGRDFEESNRDGSNILLKDPLLDPNYRLTGSSPCIDAGTASFSWNGRLLSFPEASYSGAAPDLGAFELEE